MNGDLEDGGGAKVQGGEQLAPEPGGEACAVGCQVQAHEPGFERRGQGRRLFLPLGL
jgi:hypothetical protein